MAFAIPYKWVEGLPQVARRQLFRNYEELSKILNALPSSGYDAIVVAGGTTVEASRQFDTVFAAMRYLDGQGFVTARIGVVSRGTTVTETATLGTMSTLKSVAIENVDAPPNSSTANFGQHPIWNLNGQTANAGRNMMYVIVGLTVQTGTGKTSFFDGANLQTVIGLWSRFEGGNSSTGTFAPKLAANPSYLALYNCTTVDVNPQGTFAFDTVWHWTVCGSQTWTANITHLACIYEWSGATSFTFNVANGKCIMVGCSWNHLTINGSSGSAEAFTLTATGTSAATFVITGAPPSEGDGGSTQLVLNITGHSVLHVDAPCGNITVGAPTTSSRASATIKGTAATLDVTGPVTLDCVANSLIARGKGVNGTVSVLVNTTGGVAFQGIAWTDSSLVVGARRHPNIASSTQKGYAIDASSARCVLIFAGSNEFPTASTNAGTTINIITESGGAAGATYPPRNTTATIGDGVSTSFDVTHPFGTTDVLVQVYDASTGETVYPDVTRPTTGKVTVTFADVPALNAYKVVVIG